MDVQVGTQQKIPAIESKVVSKTTTEIVNLDHTQEFQECMESYKFGNGVHSLTQFFWLLHFMNALVIFVMLSQRVQHN